MRTFDQPINTVYLEIGHVFILPPYEGLILVFESIAVLEVPHRQWQSASVHTVATNATASGDETSEWSRCAIGRLAGVDAMEGLRGLGGDANEWLQMVGPHHLESSYDRPP